MATRMQQRRGTASQWTSANPVLNAGEIGWESDTNKFKIGDGTNHWADIDYFADINSTVNPAFGSNIIFEGTTANDFETTLAIADPTADRTITLPDATGTVALVDGSGNLTISGNLTVSGTTTTINSTTINATTGIVFEGTTSNDFETTLTVTDPTADRTITFPDATGTVALTSDITVTASSTNTFTNKSIALGTNTVSGTLAELNTAVTDADLVSVAGTETLTNKTLTSPIVSGLTLSDGSIVIEGTTANEFETTLTVTDPTADRAITFPDVSGTVITTGNISDITSVGVLSSSVVFEGTTADDFELTLAAGDPTADRTVSFPDAGGTLVVDTATQTLTNKTLTSPQVSGLTLTDASIILEGSTPNDFETTITVIDPTADRTITIPDATGTVALTTDITVSASSTNTFSNKSISLASNTVTGTTAEFNTALSDSNFVTTGDTGTVTSTMITDGTIVDGDINASAAIAQSKISGLTTDLAAKAPLADPTFTGTVSAAALTLSGDLTVNGTTTTINSTTLAVDDKNIIIGDVATPSDTTADGGGITLKGATDKTFNWVDATDAWTSSEHINLASGKSLYLNGTLLKDTAETLTNKTLTSPKINLGINAQTGTTYTFVLADDGKFLTASNASAITVTIPPISSVAYPVGAQLNIVQKGAGQVTFAQGAGVTIRSTGATPTAPKLRVQYSSATAVHEGSDIWYVVGDIA
jgi:hypothetical protein